MDAISECVRGQGSKLLNFSDWSPRVKAAALTVIAALVAGDKIQVNVDLRGALGGHYDEAPKVETAPTAPSAPAAQVLRLLEVAP